MLTYSVRHKISPPVPNADKATEDDIIMEQVRIRGQDKSIAHLSFLFEAYEGKYWWWESLECLRYVPF